MEKFFTFDDVGIDSSILHNWYKPFDIKWTKPKDFNDINNISTLDIPNRCVYIITRYHGNMKDNTPVVEYIGLSTNIHKRFKNHKTAQNVSSKRGDTKISFGTINFSGYRKETISNILESIEHILNILIFTLNPTENIKKVSSHVKQISRDYGWHINNVNHKNVVNYMPKEILYPCVAIKN